MLSLKSVQMQVVVFALGAIAALCLSAPSTAQSLVPPPAVSVVDQNGVNLANGKFQLPDLDVGIGASGSGLSRVTQEGSDNWTGTTDTGAPPPGYASAFTYNLSYGGSIFRFVPVYNPSTSTWTPGPYPALSGGPERLSCANENYDPTSSSGSCTVTLGDGTKLIYDTGVRALGSVVKPDGETITLTYYQASGVKAVKSVSSSLGWMLKYEVDGSYVVNKITAINTAATYCDPAASSCSVASSYPSVTKSISGGTTTIARNGTNVISYTVSGGTTTVTPTGGVTKTITSYPSGTYSGRVYQVSIGGSTWTYSYAAVASGTETTITAPNGTTRKVVVSDIVKKVVSQTDEVGRVTTYGYSATAGNTFGRLYQVINPDGNSLTGGYTYYEYNTAGDVTKTVVMPKGGTTNGNNASAAAMVTTAVYGNACATNLSNVHYCHKPTSVTDAAGVVTNYVYDTTHGGLRHIYKAPVNGVQAETRFQYWQHTPYIKNASGNLVAQPQVWRQVQSDACMTMHQNQCVNGTDERRTAIGFSGNNVLPTTTTVKRGDGSLAQTSTVAYNDNGQIVSATGPKGGAANQTFSFYDTLGRSTGTIGIDPDDPGPLLRKASRNYFDTAGRVWKVETGTVTGTDQTALNNISVLASDTNEFSSTTGLAILARHYNRDPATSVVTQTYLTQKSYDNMFRADCVAQRLNPAVFSTIASTGACTLGAVNADGTRDRITKYNYHAVTGALVSTMSGYGTPTQLTDVTNTYDDATSTSTGTLSFVTDGKGNKTSYYYDAFNRLIKTCYPLSGSGGTSSTTDCEQIVYSSAFYNNSRAYYVSLRDGNNIFFNYDALGRVSSKTGAVSESFTYDNFGQVLTHTNNNVTATYTYNSLGWLLSDAQPMGTVSYEYDTYGRRSRLWWPGNTFSVTYGYNNDDSLYAAYENGSTGLFAFGQDDYGRRIWTWRPNAQHTYYNYDPNNSLLLTSMPQGSVNTLSFAYNSAGQIKSRTNSAAPLDFNPALVSTTYVNDGLNRIATINGSGLGYDNRGNLNADSGNTYTYNFNNLLTSALQSGATTTLLYDAEDRLQSVSKNGITTKFLYDGVDLIAEYDSNNTLLRRYVHGAGVDEPLVMYDNVYVNNMGTRYFLHADNQGTITHVTNDNGSLNTVYAYDSYGLKQTVSGSLSSRFSYTGQAWLSEIGMYYYKARLYNPAVGRFMQTDPIDYGDGINWYAYVGNDPVNMIDPSGTYSCGQSSMCQPHAIPTPAREVTVVGTPDPWAAYDRFQNMGGACGLLGGGNCGPVNTMAPLNAPDFRKDASNENDTLYVKGNKDSKEEKKKRKKARNGRAVALAGIAFVGSGVGCTVGVIGIIGEVASAAPTGGLSLSAIPATWLWTAGACVTLVGATIVLHDAIEEDVDDSD